MMKWNYNNKTSVQKEIMKYQTQQPSDETGPFGINLKRNKVPCTSLLRILLKGQGIFPGHLVTVHTHGAIPLKKMFSQIGLYECFTIRKVAQKCFIIN